MAVITEKGVTDLLLPGFLEYLAGRGFIIGTGHYLRLQELLLKLGPHCPPGELKYLLCPLFAAGEHQQTQFYRAFDSFFKPLLVLQESEIPAGPPGEPGRQGRGEPGKPRRWHYLLLAVLLLILAALIFYRLGDIPGEKTFSPGKATAGAVPTKPGGQEPGPGGGAAGTAGGTGPKRGEWTYRPSFQEKYGYMIWGVGVLAPFIIFLLVEGYQYHRRRLVLMKQRGKKPPYVWPLRVEPPGTTLFKNEVFYRSARLLRRRLPGETRVLDIDKTVAASIERAGFPEPRLRVITRPPEYLFLIDLPAYRDHFSRWFGTMVEALEKEGLYVTRYFYEGDPRVCFKEPGQEREYLVQLQGRYSDSRLIICGDGAGMVDPFTGDLYHWTALFRAWRERALLTPLPLGQWRLREIELAGEFLLLPASTRGLGTVVEYFQAPDRAGAKVLTREERQMPYLAPGRESDGEALREYLGGDAYRWLCACAVWPGLHWDLTLYLGTLPCLPGNLVSEENLMRLLHLPWFRTGTMPEELRWELLTAMDKDIHRGIRAALIDLLDRDPAPRESAAYDDYRLNVAAQRWILARLDRRDRRDPKKRRERLTSLKEFHEGRIQQDYTLVRFLESAPVTPLQMVLPKRLRKIFYKKGVPFFGVKNVYRVALTLLAAAAAFLFLKPPALDMPLEVRYIQSQDIPVYQNDKKAWEADYGSDIKMVWIEPGEFTMGQTPEEKKWLIEQLGEKDYNSYYKDETRHSVYLDGYWMGKTEVTVKQFGLFVNVTGYVTLAEKEGGTYTWTGEKWEQKEGIHWKNPGYKQDENHPVTCVSWIDAVEYCKWFTAKTGLTFKLPTETQWEKAARGTDQRQFPWGNSSLSGDKVNFADKQAWLTAKFSWADKNIDDGYAYTAPVGSYPAGASPYGLMDMAGNVWEWCSDWYGPYNDNAGPQKNPTGPAAGTDRVLRGGGWVDGARYLRCSHRNYGRPSFRLNYVGFRLCQEN